MDPYHNGYTRPSPNCHYRQNLTRNQPWNARASMFPRNSCEYGATFEKYSRWSRPWSHDERTENWDHKSGATRLQSEAESKAPFYVGPAYHYFQPESYHDFHPFDHRNQSSRNQITPHRGLLPWAPHIQISSPAARYREGDALTSSVKAYQENPRRSASPSPARFSRPRPRTPQGRGSTSTVTRIRRNIPPASRVDRAHRHSPLGIIPSRWQRGSRASTDLRPPYEHINGNTDHLKAFK